MKRLTMLLSLVIILVMVASCAPAAAPTAAPAKTFKVGLLSPGPVKDQGWNQSAYDGFVRMQKELGAEFSYVELGESPSDFEKAFRDYGSKGFDMVLGHGFQFQDSAVAVAKDYPKTLFFVTSSTYWDPKLPNVIGINTNAEPYYVLGFIAGKMGKGGGFVGGVNIPPIKQSEIAFTGGAQYAKPGFPVKVTYLGNWTDIAAAKEAASGMISEGADFVVPNANIAGNGVYQAAVEKKVWAFGTFGDQTKQAPKNIIANYVLDLGQGLLNVAKSVKDGSFKATSNIVFGLKDPDVNYIVYNDGADLKLPQDVKDAAAQVTKDIVSGKIIAVPAQ